MFVCVCMISIENLVNLIYHHQPNKLINISTKKCKLLVRISQSDHLVGLGHSDAEATVDEVNDLKAAD